jgi:DNA polymerase
MTVPGVGTGRPRLVLVGEAPGANEDRCGEPFIGRAGDELNKLLVMLGVCRKQVYITNICKCRPPANRDPYDDEREACIQQWLFAELLNVARRRLVVPLGKVAMSCFLGDRSIFEAAGRVWSTEHLSETLWGRLAPWGSPVLTVFPMLHPAATFRSGAARKQFWKDAEKLKLLLKRRGRPRRKQRRPR